MKRILNILFTMILGIFSCFGSSEQSHNKLFSLSSDSLYRKATQYVSEYPDSALMYFSIVEGRYNPRMNTEETKLCIDALLKKWAINFYTYYDYADAYECLLKAQEIMEESGIQSPEVDLQIGILHQVIYEQTNDNTSGEIALSYYLKGLKESLEMKDSIIINPIASNLGQHAFRLGKLKDISSIWESYIRDYPRKESFVYNYNRKMYEALALVAEEDYKRGYDIFDSLYHVIPEDKRFVRYKMNASLNRALILMKQGDYLKASKILEEPLGIAEKNRIKDGQIELYELLSLCHKATDDTLNGLLYENHGLQLKDSLISFSQLSRLKDVKANRDTRKIKERLITFESQNKMVKTIIVIVSIFFFIVCCLLFILYNRHKKLKESNHGLYIKNIDILKQNEELSQVRKDYEDLINRLDSEDKKDEKEKPAAIKYTGSNLDESDKSRLMSAIMSVMENDNEYLKPDFTIERLSEIVNSKPKSVSQVINEKRECNFNNFINSFRIKEACRRLSDPENYGMLTLDAIAKSVGFRARSSFFNAFKNVTGLTPSQFQKMAVADHKTIVK